MDRKLRDALFHLEDVPNADELRDGLLARQPILLDGRLAEQPELDAERLQYDVWVMLEELPGAIRAALADRHADGISARELNLVTSGAELVVRVMQAWVNTDGVDYPPVDSDQRLDRPDPDAD